MKHLIFKVLFLLLMPTMIDSQTDYSKDEISNLWTKLANRTDKQSDYKLHFESPVVSFIDSLKILGIDTIGAYGEKYVGSYSTPWMAIVHWVDNGETFHSEIVKSCSYETKKINYSVLIRFYLNNNIKLGQERIMPNINSASIDKNGEIKFSDTVTDHTTHYLIFCDVGNDSIFIKFNEFDFEDEESLFHEDNNNSIIKSWRDLILDQLNELK